MKLSCSIINCGVLFLGSLYKELFFSIEENYLPELSEVSGVVNQTWGYSGWRQPYEV